MSYRYPADGLKLTGLATVGGDAFEDPVVYRTDEFAIHLALDTRDGDDIAVVPWTSVDYYAYKVAK